MSMIKIGSDGRPLGAPTLAAFLDKKNGLMWSAEDIGGEDGLTFDKAVEACKNYRGAGFDDWRLPTIDELETLRDRTRYDPAAPIRISALRRPGIGRARRPLRRRRIARGSSISTTAIPAGTTATTGAASVRCGRSRAPVSDWLLAELK
jgi:hypothetical protein